MWRLVEQRDVVRRLTLSCSHLGHYIPGTGGLNLTEVPQLHRVVLVRIRGIATGRPLVNEDHRYARIRPLAGGLARQRALITTAVGIVGDSCRFLVLAGGGKPPTAP